jgi:hypothetical protein
MENNVHLRDFQQSESSITIQILLEWLWIYNLTLNFFLEIYFNQIVNIYLPKLSLLNVIALNHSFHELWVCGVYKSILSSIRFHIILTCDVYSLDHTIIHWRINHTLIMPTIYTMNNVLHWIPNLVSYGI